MSRKYFAAAVIYFIALAYFEVEVMAKTEKDLWRHLFPGQDYDKHFRPVKNPKTVVPVSVGLVPIVAVEDTEWKDEYLTWNPKDFDDIEQLTLPVSKVWNPSLSFYLGNFDSSYLPDASSSLLYNVKSTVVIRYDGEVIWMTQNSARRDMIYSRGKRACVISIISWSYDVSQMNIDIDSKVNGSSPRISMQASKELKYLNWSKQPFPLIHFTLEIPH